jgi:hypothetical protein
MKAWKNKQYRRWPVILLLGAAGCTMPGPTPRVAAPLEFPVPFPAPPLSRAQKAEVAACDVEGLAGARYSESLEAGDLEAAYAAKSSCDWAALAFAHAARSTGDSIPTEGVDGFKRAASTNHGFAFSSPLFYAYFGAMPLVEAPDFGDKPITRLNVAYRWSGLGDPPSVRTNFEIVDADKEPVVLADQDLQVDKTVDSQIVQRLAASLTDLLPIDRRLDLVVCTDNYLSWDVTMEFGDGSKLQIGTDSNFLGFGGPWQTTIDGQLYLQYGYDFATALYELVEELNAPRGQPFALTCFPESVFDKAFPGWEERVPATPTSG